MKLLNQSSADIYLTRLLELHNKTNILESDKIIQLRVQLELLSKELTENEPQSFTTLFSRTQFIHIKYNLSQKFESNTSGIRILANKILHDSFIPSDEDIYSSFRAFIEIILTLSDVELSDEIQQIYNQYSTFNFTSQQQKNYTKETIDDIKVNVLNIGELQFKDDTNSKFVDIKCNSTKDESEIKIRIWELSYSNTFLDYYDKDGFIETILRTWQYATIRFMNLTHFKDNFYSTNSKTIIILEPDFLIDISNIAETVQSKYQNHSLFLLKKFFLSHTSLPMFKGSLVNSIFDSIIVEENKNAKEIIQEVVKANPLYAIKFNKEELNSVFIDINNSHLHALNSFKSSVTSNSTLTTEPSFFSDTYGIQGRLDLLIESENDTNLKDVVELKSGSPPNYDTWPNHSTQTILYSLILYSVYGSEKSGISSILYSKANLNPLRNVPFYESNIKSIMNIRNHIIADIFNLAQKKHDFLNKFNINEFGGYPRFDEHLILSFESYYKELDELSMSYFQNFLSFTFRELINAKIGSEINKEGSSNGMASLWLDSVDQKQQNYEIISELTFYSFSDSKSELTFKRQSQNNINFREKDLVILYPQIAKSITNTQIYRGVIEKITKDYLIIKLRNKQLESIKFLNIKHWAVEHDFMDNNYYMNVVSLVMLIKNKYKMNLILGLDSPKILNFQYNYDAELTEDQNEMIQKAVNSKDYFLLQGPPGTGKTTNFLTKTVSEIISNSSETIIILAYTNRAVNEICASINKKGLKYLHLSSTFTEDEYNLNNISEKLSIDEIKSLITETRIFISTVSSYYKYHESLSEVLSLDTIIIDEASQLTEPSIVGIISQFKRFILIGDQNQLPAVTLQKNGTCNITDQLLNNIELYDLRQSLFERLFNVCKKNNWIHAYGTLKTHFRMHSDIAELINPYYNNELIPFSEKQKEKSLIFLPSSPNKYESILSTSRIIFINSPTMNTSKISEPEAIIVVDIIKMIKEKLGAKFNDQSIGVITPWRAQISKIRNLIKDDEIQENVLIDTVERFQGSERDIIIISYAINHVNQLKQLQSLSFDFNIDRKLNVALSRAKSHLVIIGSSNILSQNPQYNNLINLIKSKNSFFTNI